MQSNKLNFEELQQELEQVIREMKAGYALYQLVYDENETLIDARLTKSNNSFEIITGLNTDKFLGKSISEIIPDILPFTLKNFGLVSETGKSISVNHYSVNLSADLEIKAFCPKKGFVAVLFEKTTAISPDINEQKHIEGLLRESKKRFSKLIELNSIPMAIANINQDIIMLNKKFTEIYGYTIDDIPNMEIWYKKAYPDSKYRAQVRQIWDNAVEKEMKFNSNIPKHVRDIICKNGELKTIEFSLVNLGDLNIISMNDISELKNKEKELKKAKDKAIESDHLKTAFLANMSHEIRTPMNGLVGFVDLLLQEEVSVEKRKFYRNIIYDSSQKLASIIEDIIEISKLETKQHNLYTEEINLNDLLLETYSTFLGQVKDKNLTMNSFKELKDSNSFIVTDSQKLKQIFNNLLSNAVKFTPEGSIEFGYKINGEKIEFFVKDTGIGISSDNINTIFERFRQADISSERKYGGTGLGLSIAKGFVELMGGKIWCKSVPQSGTVFYFTIPYIKGKQNVTLETIENKKLSPDSYRSILVAEDEEINYLYIEELLKEFNDINVTRVINGYEAINKVKEDPSICLILMDIKMPALNGYEATKKIKKIRPDLPVIAQTAYATEKDKKLAKEAGCDSYISKPIQKNELIFLVKRYL